MHPNRNATGHIKLVRRKRGDQFYVKYRLPDGRQVQKRLGPAWGGPGRPPEGHYTRRRAEEALQAILTDARRGTLAGMTATGATFRDAAAEYLRYVEYVRQIDETTVKDYRGVIDGYLLDEFGNWPIEQITPDMVDRYKERLIAEGRLSARVIVRHLTVLHGIFKRAKRAYGLERNPVSADLVERPKVVYTGDFDTFTGEEVELLAGTAEEQDAAIYRTAAFTGLRQGELLALRWADVDFVGGLLHVRRNYTDRREKMPKGKRVRSVPMTPGVIDTLAQLKERGYLTEDTDLVFCNTAGDHLDSWALRRRYYRALEKAGLRRIRFHDLRHCFGSAAITKLDAYAVQSYMGHQHYSTTQRYLHHKPRREDAQKLHEAFRGQAASPAVDLEATVAPG
jgi:integrase